MVKKYEDMVNKVGNLKMKIRELEQRETVKKRIVTRLFQKSIQWAVPGQPPSQRSRPVQYSTCWADSRGPTSQQATLLFQLYSQTKRKQIFISTVL